MSFSACTTAPCPAFEPSSGIAAVSLLAVALHGRFQKVSVVKLKLVIGLLLTVLGVMWLVHMYLEHGGA